MGMGGAVGRLVAYMVISRSTAFSVISIHWIISGTGPSVQACDGNVREMRLITLEASMH
jgi:hypothetical protein